MTTGDTFAKDGAIPMTTLNIPMPKGVVPAPAPAPAPSSMPRQQDESQAAKT